jgi:ribonuclease J
MIMTPPAVPFATWTDAPAADELRLVPIGGLGEFGMNALAVHTDQSLILVDCGQLFPGEDQPGIDRIVPDFSYLEPFAAQVKAVVLTHGHEDHIGALPYLLQKYPVPVYGTAYTLALVRGKLKEHDLDLGLLNEVADYDRVFVTEDLEVEWIPVTHSIPDACALALNTPQGVIMHSGDFKLDPTPVDGRLTGLKRMKELGQAGVRLLMADSTNVLQPGRTPSEAICRQGLDDAFRLTEGILFMATFSTNLHRLQVALDLAYAHGRCVVPLGRSIEKAITLGRESGRLKLPDDFIVDAKNAPHYPRKEVLVLCTGSQGEPQSGLSRLLRGEVKGLRIQPNDRLLLSARPIPGNEVSISRILDDAARQGAETTLEGLGPVHATGHAHREDLIELIQTLNPKQMVPVHGTYRNLQAHGKLAAGLGWSWDRISLMDGGHCLRLFKDGRVEMAGTVPVGREFVHEGVDHIVDARVVRDRLILQEDGVVFLTVMVDPESLERVGEPTVLSRGFVVLSDDQDYGALLRGAAAKAWDESPLEVRKDEELARELLRQALRRIIRKTTDTRPLVVPVVLTAPKD